MKATRTAGQMISLPPDALSAFAGQDLTARYRVCLGREDGRPRSITPQPMASLLAWDQHLVDMLRTWSWRVEVPDGQEPCFLEDDTGLREVLKTWRLRPQPAPRCFDAMFMFVIE